MREPQVQYVVESDGKIVAAVVPIALWREIESERETEYLLQSPEMKRRLLKAKQRGEAATTK